MKKTLKYIVLIFCVCAVIALIGTAIKAQNFEVWYTTTELRCRNEPNADSDILITYPQDKELQIIGVDDTGLWWQTWDGETQGWCHSYYFKDADGKYFHEPVGRYLGEFYCTGYTPSPAENGGYSVTALGDNLWNSVGWAIATDPRVIPLRTKVYIEGIGYRTARDTGGAIKGNRIDVLTGNNSASYAVTGWHKVYLAE